MKSILSILILIIAFPLYLTAQTDIRKVEDFSKNWKFTLESVNDHIICWVK